MQGFDEIYQQYFDCVFRYLRSLTRNPSLAEELTEETFFKAMRAIDRFRGDCDLQVWLCQIAKNCYFSYQSRHSMTTTLEDIPDSAEASGLEHLLVDKELAFHLHQLLHTMQEPYKEVFSLRVFGELSFREIGLLFDKTEHWACVTFHRAKHKLQERMEESK